MQSYPKTRLRRNRKMQWSRDLTAETTLTISDLIMPLFITEGEEIIKEIELMEGVFRYSIDTLIEKIKNLSMSGIKAVMLFPHIEQHLKTHNGDIAFDSNNLICRAIKAIKLSSPEIGVIADVALDPYTSHGHDGIVRDGDVDNDKTIEMLCKQALVLAQAGVDAVAPSDMMDGRIGKIRDVLEENNYHNVQIFAYSVKYASNFYAPFRTAIGSHNNLGNSDKKSYQLDYRNSNEAMMKIEMDISEGADCIIIKPAMAYLDVIKMSSQSYKIPIIAYQVSGEYFMLKNSTKNNIVDEKSLIIETLFCLKRGGARIIITYYADRMAIWLKNK